MRFLRVFDSRKRKVRGLWQRGRRHYAQLRSRCEPKRIPLDVDILDGAKAALEKIRARNPEWKPSFGRTPPTV
jgi:hypothetical protein